MFLLLSSRAGMDFLSTWVATPNLVLEGNPIAKKLGWKWGIPLNLALCFGWPSGRCRRSSSAPPVVLVAARNFQSAWLMRSLGEQHLPRLARRARPGNRDHALPVLPVAGKPLLTAGVGVAVIYFSESRADAASRSGWASWPTPGGGFLHHPRGLAPAPFGDPPPHGATETAAGAPRGRCPKTGNGAPHPPRGT